MKPIFLTFLLLSLVASAVEAGTLTVTKVASAPAANDPSVLLRQTIQDGGGNTRFRFYPERTGTPTRFDNNANAWRFTPRDRDLGQSFTVPANLTQPHFLEAITLRVGPEASANEGGAGGAAVSMQIYEVTGTPVIDQNGTSGSQRARWDTFAPSQAFTDDFYTGLTFTSLGLYTGGVLPADITTGNYMKWTMSPPLALEAGKQYAFMVMFDQPAANRGLALANWNRAVTGNLGPDDGAISFRRCGSNNNFDDVFIPDLNDAADVEIGRQSANMPTDINIRTAIDPSPVGYPDVDTYRDFVYFIHTTAPEEPPVDPPVSPITSDPNMPAGPFDSQSSRDGNGTTIRWSAVNTDVDLGAIFMSGPTTRLLRSITVQVATNNFGTNVPGIPVILDFMKVGGTLASPTFTPLWRQEGSLPATLAAEHFITFDLLEKKQALEKDGLYAFLMGVNRQAADAAQTTSDRFRLYTNSDGSGTPDSYEIRREYEFGTTRAPLTALPNLLNTTRDFYFLLKADDIKPTISSAVMTASGFEISAPSLNGGQYILQRSPNLNDPWEEIETKQGSGGILNYLDSPLPDPERYFYRIKVGP